MHTPVSIYSSGHQRTRGNAVGLLLPVFGYATAGPVGLRVGVGTPGFAPGLAHVCGVLLLNYVPYTAVMLTLTLYTPTGSIDLDDYNSVIENLLRFRNNVVAMTRLYTQPYFTDIHTVWGLGVNFEHDENEPPRPFETNAFRGWPGDEDSDPNTRQRLGVARDIRDAARLHDLAVQSFATRLELKGYEVRIEEIASPAISPWPLVSYPFGQPSSLPDGDTSSRQP